MIVYCCGPPPFDAYRSLPHNCSLSVPSRVLRLSCPIASSPAFPRACLLSLPSLLLLPQLLFPSSLFIVPASSLLVPPLPPSRNVPIFPHLHPPTPFFLFLDIQVRAISNIRQPVRGRTRLHCSAHTRLDRSPRCADSIAAKTTLAAQTVQNRFLAGRVLSFLEITNALSIPLCGHEFLPFGPIPSSRLVSNHILFFTSSSSVMSF